METLSCHNNQSAHATSIKKIFVVVKSMNIAAKFQLYSPFT